MISASLKQTVARRPGPKPAPRFTLLVGSRVKGVWEKKHAVPKLLTYQKQPIGKKEPSVRLASIERHRLTIVIGASLTAATGIVILLIGLARPAVGPLELPAGIAVLGNTVIDQEPDNEAAASAPAAPLVLKKLRLGTYRVKAGESLPAIAKKNGLDVDTLISFNALTDAHRLAKGATLTVPNHRGLNYRVRSGDSLGKISKRFNVKLDDLLDWNNLSQSVITPGQSLFIPNGRLSAAEVSRVLGTFFAWPTKGETSSNFGMRISPITGTRLFHNGLDITNALMTPIKAACDGRVAIVDYNPTYGNFVILVHANGFQTLYGHMKQIYVKKGMNLTQGQPIGAMGSTGASTGSHLHFSIFKNGAAVDPLKYLH